MQTTHNNTKQKQAITHFKRNRVHFLIFISKTFYNANNHAKNSNKERTTHQVKGKSNHNNDN